MNFSDCIGDFKSASSLKSSWRPVMKRITNPRQIAKAIETLNLSSEFNTGDLKFQIFSYEKGEQMISPLAPMTFFMFVLTGNVRIYSLKEDSTFNAIVNLNQGSILGYHEFCFESDDYTLYAEAITAVKCLVLPFKQPYKNLKTDSSFLMYLLKNALLDQVQNSEIMQRKTDLEEQVMFYIQNICQDNILLNLYFLF